MSGGCHCSCGRFWNSAELAPQNGVCDCGREVKLGLPATLMASAEAMPPSPLLDQAAGEVVMHVACAFGIFHDVCFLS